ncbi:MAG: M1 family metallopeptidase [Myxococcaceae bacterium]
MSRPDPHSFSDSTQARVRHFDWSAAVDFGAHQLIAGVTLRLAEPARGGAFDLDTRDLQIDSVTDEAGKPLQHLLHAADPVLGSRLEIQLPEGAQAVMIRYRTSKTASALQWLDPAQTHGKKHPYLFSQCQAIHARSVLPCQDTPGFRVTWSASLEVPKALTAVMAAAPRGKSAAGESATFRFEMPQAIPPYLFAFAVGDLDSRDLSPRSRVWAEPGVVEKAQHEFAEVEKHLAAAEALFGPYDWERFDLLVMPPSFPYGGMENPRLTFLTPALLAGDRSLVNVVAHELAHSWTGNLVTNISAEHFWLNEGFTVFAERRILEALEGPEMAALHAAIGHHELLRAIERFKQRPELTRLRTHLEGVDPDEAFSVVPYEKGYLFLRALEAAAGKSAFDATLKKWLDSHRFGAAATDDFLRLVEQELPGVLKQIDSDKWIDGDGIPANAPKPFSKRLDVVNAQAGKVPEQLIASKWTPAEWQLFLDATPRPFADCAALDQRFGLTQATNPEVLVAWLTLACESGYAPAAPRAQELLGSIGRMKYLRPLYQALAQRPETKATARATFEKHKASYHPIAQSVVGGVLEKFGA